MIQKKKKNFTRFTFIWNRKFHRSTTIANNYSYETRATSYSILVNSSGARYHYSWENIVRASGLWSVVQSASATGWDVLFHCVHSNARTHESRNSRDLEEHGHTRDRDAASPVVIPFTDWNLRPFVTVKEVAIASSSLLSSPVFFLRFPAHRSTQAHYYFNEREREATPNEQSTRPILISYRFSTNRAATTKSFRRSWTTTSIQRFANRLSCYSLLPDRFPLCVL